MADLTQRAQLEIAQLDRCVFTKKMIKQVTDYYLTAGSALTAKPFSPGEVYWTIGGSTDATGKNERGA